jgi:hypothetical protein
MASKRAVIALLLLVAAGWAGAAFRRPVRRVVEGQVVAVDTRARTITVRASGAAADATFGVAAAVARRVAALKPGDRVVLTLVAGAKGRRDVVTRVTAAAAVAGAPAPVVISPGSSRPPTDTVGPLRDPRGSPNVDPRQNPLRDPRVVPGLSQPAPTPTPTPTPSPR